MNEEKSLTRAFGFNMNIESKGMQLSEKEAISLWREYNEGNNSVLERFIKGYHKMILYIVGKKLGGITRNYKDDCMQVGYIAVCKAVSTYDETKGLSLSNWINKRAYWDIVRFLNNNNLVHIPLDEVTNYYKEVSKSSDTSVLYEDRFIDMLDIDIADNEECAYSFEEDILRVEFCKEILEEARHILSDREYDCLVMYCIEGAKVRKIAKKYDLPEGMVHQILARVTRKIKREFSEV